MKKKENEPYQLLDDMAANNYMWPSERLSPPKRVAWIHEVDARTKLTAQVTLLMQQMQKIQMAINAMQAHLPPICDFCSGTHHSIKCQAGNPFSSTTIEKA